MEAAAILQVSRPTVSRLLAEARRLGIVEIRVHDPSEVSQGRLADRLRSALGLDRVLLTPASTGPLSSRLAETFGIALRSVGLRRGDTALVSSGRTMFELSRVPLPSCPGVEVVPAVGGVAESKPWYQTNEISRSLAEGIGGRSHFLFAQALPTEAMRASLEVDPAFRSVVDRWPGARAAFVGIGAPPTTRTSNSSFVPDGWDKQQDVVADVCVNFLGPQGQEVHFTGSERMVRVRLETLREIPCVVGVAVGADKVPSILAAARARAVNWLITDPATAKLVLGRVSMPDPARVGDE